MRILFVQTNTNTYLNPFPLGAALVAARLRRDGHDVFFVDLMRERDPLARVREAVRRHAPELACFSIRNRDNMSTAAYADPIPAVAALVRAVAAEGGCATLLGGTAFTTYPARFLDATGATWGIAGDDLESASRFVASLAAGRPDHATPGLVHRDPAGRVVEVPFRIVGYGDVAVDVAGVVDLGRYRRGFWQAGVITRSGCPEAHAGRARSTRRPPRRDRGSRRAGAGRRGGGSRAGRPSRFYVSRETPAPWLARRLARWRRRHPFRQLAMVPFVARMALDRPWRRGPVADPG